MGANALWYIWCENHESSWSKWSKQVVCCINTICKADVDFLLFVNVLYLPISSFKIMLAEARAPSRLLQNPSAQLVDLRTCLRPVCRTPCPSRNVAKMVYWEGNPAASAESANGPLQLILISTNIDTLCASDFDFGKYGHSVCLWSSLYFKSAFSVDLVCLILEKRKNFIQQIFLISQNRKGLVPE